MSNFTVVLQSVADGRTQLSTDLLPLVYEELRRVAQVKMSRERPGQTLQPTALVHEAWLRLVGEENPPWANRKHFFAAAGEAMRRILIERARRRKVMAKGGYAVREEEFDSCMLVTAPDEELLAVDDALERLAAVDPEAALLVKLRYFSGLSMPQCAEALGKPLRNAERIWTFARAWLRKNLKK